MKRLRCLGFGLLLGVPMLPVLAADSVPSQTSQRLDQILRQEDEAKRNAPELFFPKGQLPEEYQDKDVTTLRRAGLFALGGIGFAGTTSDGEAALRAILARKDAARLLLVVFEYGTDAGRCYALLGLQKLQPESYRTAMAWLRKHASEKITTMSGCILQSDSTEQILNAIEIQLYSVQLPASQS